MESERDAILEKINSLQIKQSDELIVLKEQFQITYDSFKPLNLLKSTFQDVTSSPEIKDDLVNGALNLATGLISKNILFGMTEKPIKTILNYVFRFVAKKLKPNKD